jgi:hypothetical protein
MAASTYRLTISYNTAGQFAQNVLHYSFDDALFSSTIAAAAALNTAFNTHVSAGLKAALSIHTQILSYKSRKATGGGGFEAVLLGVAGDIGTRAGDLSASGLAPLIRMITNQVPPVSGRIFLPGISDDDAVDGFIGAAYFTDMTNLAGLLDDTLTLTGGGSPVATPVLLSRSPILATFPVHICVPSPYISTQRKRQRPV